jgi:hypothetical protein
LPRVYRYLEASPALLITPFQALSFTLNKPAELRQTIGTAHLFYFFAVDVPCFEAELEMFAKDTLDFFELLRGKQFC